MGLIINLIGRKFGDLEVLEQAGKHLKRREALWLCRCVCGTLRTVRAGHLKNGNTKSCGCYKTRKLNAFNYKHGQTKNPTHNSWNRMIQRCENPHNNRYALYGGRGIKVCQDWHDFRNFFRDMGKRPDGMTLDRLDSDGDYSKENCRWATASQQAFNRRPYTHKTERVWNKN